MQIDICCGFAAGVMLAASFHLKEEEHNYSSGNWVVLGILAAGIFNCLCKKTHFLEQYGEMSMFDIEGSDASKVVLVVGIMTLHSLEYLLLSQGRLVTSPKLFVIYLKA